jgi:protein-S-isoprenylcysteine O-methyltransferase Ste14
VSDSSEEHAEPTEPPGPAAPDAEPDPPQGMVPARRQRRTAVERGFMRIIATGGVVAVGVVLGAVLVSQDVAGWIVGLVVALTSVVLAALLWSSRQL